MYSEDPEAERSFNTSPRVILLIIDRIDMGSQEVNFRAHIQQLHYCIFWVVMYSVQERTMIHFP